MNKVPTSYVLKKYGINKADILTGVCCPHCNYLPLVRKKQKWYCPSCDKFSVDAHKNALIDYFLLIDLNITNQQFREFTHLDSINIAGRMLRSENLKSTGSKKNRIYFPVTFL
ncbi:Sjogren's syndrome/scleroderma autoantigen 1 family protein [Bacillus sp. X1(2014)]|uniref:Sjogren's syndrome/scleroderma autoantigen 1 family protein n=1 Tax=Bacillus sp. X1(2014) TaxID=1565991 RepID=UPI0011A7DAB9|nr:Sjogren's syndrome/scleroderma autoantigen 1 family protein [Bacillus sp. X1(2014)]